jgi:hypothetical protein
MKKTYSTPKMVVHGNFEELTQAAGNNKISDVLILNGTLITTNDDSLDVTCTGSSCVNTPAKP